MFLCNLSRNLHLLWCHFECFPARRLKSQNRKWDAQPAPRSRRMWLGPLSSYLTPSSSSRSSSWGVSTPNSQSLWRMRRKVRYVFPCLCLVGVPLKVSPVPDKLCIWQQERNSVVEYYQEYTCTSICKQYTLQY